MYFSKLKCCVIVNHSFFTFLYYTFYKIGYLRQMIKYVLQILNNIYEHKKILLSYFGILISADTLLSIIKHGRNLNSAVFRGLFYRSGTCIKLYLYSEFVKSTKSINNYEIDKNKIY